MTGNIDIPFRVEDFKVYTCLSLLFDQLCVSILATVLSIKISDEERELH